MARNSRGKSSGSAVKRETRHTEPTSHPAPAIAAEAISGPLAAGSMQFAAKPARQPEPTIVEAAAQQVNGGDRAASLNGSEPVENGNGADTHPLPDTAAGEMATQDEAPAVSNGHAGDAPPGRRLQGYIDEANANRITGWMWDPEHPDAPLTLELVDGDKRLAAVKADRYRLDLHRAGIGDGRYAFIMSLEPGVLPGGRQLLRLRCAVTGTEVPGSPITIDDGTMSTAEQTLYEAPAAYLAASAAKAAGVNGAAAPAKGEDGAPVAPVIVRANGNGAAPAAAPPDGALRVIPELEPAPQQSNIDFADWTGIRGWIWDPKEPEKRIVLELLDGDTPLTTIVASEYRPDLERAGIGDGAHGFTIAFSETVLPYARHTLHLRPVGSQVELPSFPLVLTREQAGLDPTVTRFILSNVLAEADRAETAEDLAPIITSLVEFLDAALSRYFYHAEADAADAADLLNPGDFAPQLQHLVESIQRSYPPIVPEIEPNPVVSIVIPVFNKFDLTYNCVRSIVEQGAQVPYEIIVVDDCSRDETMLASFAFGPGVRLIRASKNGGFIRSCNGGFDAARGEYVVFLNNDTEVKPRWLDELYETLQRDPSIGIVGGKLLFPDGSLQECGGIVWRLGDGWNWGRGQAADDPRFCFMRDADYVSGALLMIKSSLFAELGKFDDHFAPMYYEDTDLCFRARQAGYRVVVQPASEIVHFEGASAGTSTGGGMKRYQAVNHRKFFERWKDVLALHRFNGELPELEAERNVRQRALFIDDSVPEPDKDAGSNAALQHMLSLQRLGYKVSFIPGDNMARIEPYTTDLQRRGIECLYHPYYFSVEDVFRKQATAFELVYLHRYSNASKYAGMIRQHFPKARILYNVADLHFLRVQRQAEVMNDPPLRQKADQLRRLELGAMSFVDCVIVHSNVEAELLREIAPDIEVQVIPWTIPLRDSKKAASNKKPGIAFIGGYRHPPNIDAAAWAAQSIMPELRGRVPGIELLLVGSHMTPEVSGLAAKDIIPLGYVPSLDSVFERVRLTIAPLRYGAGLKGKVLESLAAGIPCVMTTVAAEGVDLPDDLKCLIADEPGELAERIATLCRDEAEYRRVARAGKAHIRARYSPERIDGLIREACGGE